MRNRRAEKIFYLPRTKFKSGGTYASIPGVLLRRQKEHDRRKRGPKRGKEVGMGRKGSGDMRELGEELDSHNTKFPGPNGQTTGQEVWVWGGCWWEMGSLFGWFQSHHITLSREGEEWITCSVRGYGMGESLPLIT